MKSYRTYMLAASITLLALSGAARAQSPDNDGCSNSTLKGDYAFTLSGQILNPDGTFTLVNGVAITNFDGKTDAQDKGGLTQVDFVVTNPPPPHPGPPPPTDPLTVFARRKAVPTKYSRTARVKPRSTSRHTRAGSSSSSPSC